jgi:hypothetical protein
MIKITEKKIETDILYQKQQQHEQHISIKQFNRNRAKKKPIKNTPSSNSTIKNVIKKKDPDLFKMKYIETFF